MNMNIKTKLTYGIGLLFVLITLLGGCLLYTSDAADEL